MKYITEPCPTCGHPWPVARACARPDCGKEFRNRRADAIYCSKRCAGIAAMRQLRERQKIAKEEER